MDFNIISDSCCDIPEQLNQDNKVSIVPLSIIMDGTSFIDDEKLNMDLFFQKMKESSKITSAAPSPGLYLDKLKSGACNFIVTLSNKVSGSFSSAVASKDLAEEDKSDIHVFDSLSASAGQMLIILKIKELIASGFAKDEIIAKTEIFIKSMKTYFVSQDLSNFIKNGRLGKVKGKLISVLGIRPVLGADENGDITFYTHARGDNQTVTRLIDLIKNSNKKIEDIVITHCNNSELAAKLRKTIEQTVSLRNIVVAQTKGLSSMYALSLIHI